MVDKISTSAKPHPFTCKVLTVYIAHGVNKVLSPRTVYKHLLRTSNVKQTSVRSAIQKLFDKGLLNRSGRGGYYLPDKKDADKYISEKIYLLGRLPSWSPKVAVEGWWDTGRWLDLAEAVIEHAKIPDFRVDSYDYKMIRSYLSKVSKVSRGDRAGWLSHTESSFGFSISKKGSVKLFLHSLDYVDDVSKFLSECGLTDVRKRLFFDRLYSMSSNANVSVEMNVLLDRKNLPEKFVVETQVGNEIIWSRINYSGGNAELETSGGLGLVHNFLNHLGSIQHSAAIEYLQAKSLSSIDDSVNRLVNAFEKIAEEVRKSKNDSLHNGSEKNDIKRIKRNRPGVG